MCCYCPEAIISWLVLQFERPASVCVLRSSTSVMCENQTNGDALDDIWMRLFTCEMQFLTFSSILLSANYAIYDCLPGCVNNKLKNDLYLIKQDSVRCYTSQAKQQYVCTKFYEI